jgi:preprotein translocase subunit YajC
MVNKGEKIMKFMCEAAAGGSNIAIYVILIVMVLAMLILPYFSNKKRNQQYMEMINGIKVGSVVKTAGGVIGRVTKITDKGEVKTIILETGAKSNKSTMEFDINSIYCVLESSKAEKTEEVVETKEVEEKTEEVVEEKTTETAEKEVKKAPKAKKTTTSKTKKSTK